MPETDVREHTGTFINHACAIETLTGRAFSLSDPRTHEVDIADIAGPLSRICRFNGQCQGYYSVAEHCVHVANIFRDRHGDKAGALAALLHDAAEAYIGDSVRPLKLMLPEIRQAERRIEACIYERFGCTQAAEQWKSAIKQIDNEMLRLEASLMMHSKGREWSFDGVEPADVTIEWLNPGRACIRFLGAFHDLTDAQSKGAHS